MSVTSIEQFKRYAGGSEVELPGFVSGETITVKLRRPSVMSMVADGKVPNPLMGIAAEMFNGGVNSTIHSADGMKNSADLLRIYAQAALVEPTYEELEKAGVQFTDGQLTAIYNYVMTGVDQVKRFREIKANYTNPESGAQVQKAAKRGSKRR